MERHTDARVELGKTTTMNRNDLYRDPLHVRIALWIANDLRKNWESYLVYTVAFGGLFLLGHLLSLLEVGGHHAADVWG